MKKILIFILFFFTACGYQAIHKVDNRKNLSFNEINLEGNSKINKKIVNAIKFKKDETNQTLNEITINSSKKTEATSKNSKGQVVSYRTIIKLNLIIKKDNVIIKEKQFSKDFSYNNKENKFELSEYQKEIETNLVNKIIEDLVIFLNL